MIFLSILTALTCVVAISGNAIQQKQNCNSNTFACDFNIPCTPACVPGQEYYPGTNFDVYVTCYGDNLEKCKEKKCPRDYFWNQQTSECAPRTQDCKSGVFTCDFNNPCKPLCNDGQIFYPGKWQNTYIECTGNNAGMCREKYCPDKHYWNIHTEKCLESKQDCNLQKFSCDYNNPCKPLCNPEQTVYPGAFLNNYIECSGDLQIECQPKECPNNYYWNKHTKSCEEVTQNCDSDVFSCDYNNPCSPLCTEDQLLYPGNWQNTFITCNGENNGRCREEKCPSRETFDPESLECVPE